MKPTRQDLLDRGLRVVQRLPREQWGAAFIAMSGVVDGFDGRQPWEKRVGNVIRFRLIDAHRLDSDGARRLRGKEKRTLSLNARPLGIDRERGDAIACIDRALDGLPGRLDGAEIRVALALVSYNHARAAMLRAEGLTHAQVAARMGMCESTIYRLMREAREFLETGVRPHIPRKYRRAGSSP